jgi:Uma2 family endonuclease
MKLITDIRQLDITKSYTYADYLTWQFNDRVELIMGKIFNMSPAPSSQHQHITVAISSSIYQFLRNKPCKVFSAPFDVLLPDSSGVKNTVVQPDITVVCDPSKITKEGCNGAPDLVVEVISKSSVKKDLHEKYGIYEKVGVKEYWIVQPNDRSLIIFRLDESGHYLPSKPITKGDKATSTVLPGLEIDMDELFVDVVEEPVELYREGVTRI